MVQVTRLVIVGFDKYNMVIPRNTEIFDQIYVV